MEIKKRKKRVDYYHLRVVVHTLPYNTYVQTTCESEFCIIGAHFKALTPEQGSLNLLPALFSSNPNQTHLNQLIKVLLGILQSRCVEESWS